MNERSGQYNPSTTYYRHIGLFAFTSEFLQTFANLEATPLQLEEDIELIKTLEYGRKIKVKVDFMHYICLFFFLLEINK